MKWLLLAIEMMGSWQGGATPFSMAASAAIGTALSPSFPWRVQPCVVHEVMIVLRAAQLAMVSTANAEQQSAPCRASVAASTAVAVRD